MWVWRVELWNFSRKGAGEVISPLGERWLRDAKQVVG